MLGPTVNDNSSRNPTRPCGEQLSLGKLGRSIQSLIYNNE